MPQRIIFMGTPDFAVPALTKLYQAYDLIAVVTQPDRPSGRGRKRVAPPVKQAAAEANLPVLQPPTLRDPAVVARLRSLKPDLIVVAAFGQILRPEVLNIPPHGCINVHASLLPRWRGAAPIAAAIRAGDTETGITLMLMEAGLDTGPVIRAQAIAITPQDNQETLSQALADLGAELLIETLPDWLAGKITPQPQDDRLATLAPRLKKEEGLLDWTRTAVEIERHVRAFYPWPGTFTYWQDKPLKILTASLQAGPVGSESSGLPPGTVFNLGKEVAVATGQGVIVLAQIQLAGRQAMAAADFRRGNAHFVGSVLSGPPSDLG